MPAKNLIRVVALLLFTSTLQAENTDYKTPATMTAEDRSVIAQSVMDYQSCLSENIAELQPRIGDPRALTDAAMELCKELLSKFEQKLATRNFSPTFRQRYVSMVKSRSAGEALKHAMFMAAQQPVEPEAAGSNHPQTKANQEK